MPLFRHLLSTNLQGTTRNRHSFLHCLSPLHCLFFIRFDFLLSKWAIAAARVPHACLQISAVPVSPQRILTTSPSPGPPIPHATASTSENFVFVSLPAAATRTRHSCGTRKSLARHRLFETRCLAQEHHLLPSSSTTALAKARWKFDTCAQEPHASPHTFDTFQLRATLNPNWCIRWPPRALLISSPSSS